MGRLPQYLFVVRHGNRLDAADKKWHLSSPTPYDSPLTYGGFRQSRLVGNQIASILEQAKVEEETSGATDGKRRRFRVVIHSSPFLRCVQTSVGISAGLAQVAPEALHRPSDVFVPLSAPAACQDSHSKFALLRLDSFLGEWLSPEYFENITPPSGSALMLGSAKADLLKREPYNIYTDNAAQNASFTTSSPLWNGSPTLKPSSPPAPVATESESPFHSSSMAMALAGALDEKEGYIPPQPNYAVSGSGKIPDGLVAHARDHCVAVDYQWDSMRSPLEFGDGGKLGEEWTAMHRRFRAGIRSLLNWYATSDSPEKMVSTTASDPNRDTVNGPSGDREDDTLETVVVIVSHGAGCNALIGAITHQPVLMDVGIASITMAMRRPGINYGELAAFSPSQPAVPRPFVPVDRMYELRMSASTEHLQSSTSTPVSSRPSQMSNIWNAGSRGRTATMPASSGPVVAAFVRNDPLGSPGSRSSSASAAIGHSQRRESAPQRLPPAMAVFGAPAGPGKKSPSPPNGGPGRGPPASGLWEPRRSSLRLMDDGNEDGEENDDLSDMPSFETNRLLMSQGPGSASTLPSLIESPLPSPTAEAGPFSTLPTPSPLSTAVDSAGIETKAKKLPAGVRLNTHFGAVKEAEEMNAGQLGDGAGGLWGPPLPPGEAERFRDLRSMKRRWTVNEHARI